MTVVLQLCPTHCIISHSLVTTRWLLSNMRYNCRQHQWNIDNLKLRILLTLQLLHWQHFPSNQLFSINLSYIPGKSYSLVGVDSSCADFGVIPTAISWLYQLIEERKTKTSSRFSVRITCLDIRGHNEELTDLLASCSNDGKILSLHICVCMYTYFTLWTWLILPACSITLYLCAFLLYLMILLLILISYLF